MEINKVSINGTIYDLPGTNIEEYYAKKDGTYPDLTAGAAINLEGNTDIVNASMYRPVGGNEDVRFGTASIQKIQGNSIAWNQLYNNSTLELISSHKYLQSEIVDKIAVRKIQKEIAYTDESTSRMLFDLTLIYGADNEPTTPEQFEADYQRWFGKPLEYEEYDEGSIRTVKATGIKTVGFNLYGGGEFSGTGVDWRKTILFNNDIGYTGRIYIQCDTEKKENEIVYVQVNYTDGSIQYIGTTREETRATLSGLTNFGKIIKEITGSYGAEGLSTCKVTNICINLSWSGKRDGEYEEYWEETQPLPITSLTSEGKVIFPDGLKRAGDVCDEVFVLNGVTKAIKRVESVDLGSLNWSMKTVGEGAYNCFVSTTLNILKVLEDYTVPNIICSKYLTEAYRPFYWDGIYKTISIQNIRNRPGNYAEFFIKDDNYTDANSLKSSLQGVIAYYALETPETYIIDNFELPVVYKIDDFGTEQIISPENTIAPVITSKYGINAVDTLRRLPQRYISAESDSQFLSKLGTLMGVTWNREFDASRGCFVYNYDNIQPDNVDDAIIYSTNNNEAIQVTGVKSNDYYPEFGYGVIVPSEAGTCPSFTNLVNLKSVILGSNITKMVASTFSGCSKLEEVYLSDLITEIPPLAFSECSSLNRVVLGSKVTSIRNYAFRNCFNLFYIDIPATVTEINDYSFYNCYKLTSGSLVNLKTTTLGSYAFYGCRNLEEITIPSGVTKISDYLFNSCTSLCKVVLPTSVISIGNGAFGGCTSLSNIDLSNIKTLGSYAFEDCTSLKYVDLSSLTGIISGGVFGNTSVEYLKCNIGTSNYAGYFKGIKVIDANNNFSTPTITNKSLLLSLEALILRNQNPTARKLNGIADFRPDTKIYVPGDQLEEFKANHPGYEHRFFPISTTVVDGNTISDTIVAGGEYYNNVEGKTITNLEGFSGKGSVATITSEYPITFTHEKIKKAQYIDYLVTENGLYVYTLKYMPISSSDYAILLNCIIYESSNDNTSGGGNTGSGNNNGGDNNDDNISGGDDNKEGVNEFVVATTNFCDTSKLEGNELDENSNPLDTGGDDTIYIYNRDKASNLANVTEDVFLYNIGVEKRYKRNLTLSFYGRNGRVKIIGQKLENDGDNYDISPTYEYRSGELPTGSRFSKVTAEIVDTEISRIVFCQDSPFNNECVEICGIKLVEHE